MLDNKLRIKQLDRQFSALLKFKQYAHSEAGWIYTIRTALGMTLQQISSKLNVSKQNISLIEQREKEGNVTLNTLRDVAHAMDMELVYAIMPKDETLEKLIERKAREIAHEIVKDTSQNMLLEDQEVYQSRIEDAIQERTKQLIYEMPKYLWD